MATLMKRPSDIASLALIFTAFAGFAATGAFKTDLAVLIGQDLADKISAGIDIVSGFAGAGAFALRVQANPSPPPGQQHVTVPVDNPSIIEAVPESQQTNPDPTLTKGP